VELENVRKLVAKMQEDSEKLERERGSRRVEGVRERLFIMEKVESLSHLYLGGLEEVRADVFNVKLRCRDRNNWKINGKSFSNNSKRLLLPPEMNFDPCLSK